jgi:hypothetical protein
MKTYILLTALALASGCSYNYPYSHSSIGSSAPPEMPTSQYTVVNNSGYPLKLYQDGQYMGEVPLGQVRPIKGTLLWRRTVVTVTGCDSSGSYIGSDSWTFEFGVPEAWTVIKLNKPKQPR